MNAKRSRSSLQPASDASFNLHEKIRELRVQRQLSGVELCRRAGDLDPKTLTAVEKGRIKNPSIQTLLSISRGLGVTVSELFREVELDKEENFYSGTQKGAFQMEFARKGIKIVSFTPFVRDFFCGKLIFSSKKKIDESFLNHPLPLYVSVLVGRFEAKVEDRVLSLKEGENLFFKGSFKYSLQNALHRDSVLFLTTAPSFL